MVDVITLVLAIIGAVTGIGSTVWIVIAHRRSSRRCEVTAFVGYLAHGGLVTMPIDNPNELTVPPEARELVIGVNVVSTGLLPIVVTKWGITVAKATLTQTNHTLSPTLPVSVESGDGVTLFMALDGVAALAEASRVIESKRWITGMVTLGTGEEIRSRNRVKPAALFQRIHMESRAAGPS